jgi:transcriptional regulator with XRE-family HTH domain
MNPRDLRKLRLSLGLSPRVCAADMGVTRQTVYNLESGRTTKEASLYYYELYLQEVKRRRDDARNQM